MAGGFLRTNIMSNRIDNTYQISEEIEIDDIERLCLAEVEEVTDAKSVDKFSGLIADSILNRFPAMFLGD